MKIDNILVDNDTHGNNPVLTRRIKNLVTGSEKIMDVVLIDYFDEYVDIQVYLDDYRHPITRESAMRFECQNLAKDENGDSLYDHFGQWNGAGIDPNY